jgi:hypothetical protein
MDDFSGNMEAWARILTTGMNEIIQDLNKGCRCSKGRALD